VIITICVHVFALALQDALSQAQAFPRIGVYGPTFTRAAVRSAFLPRINETAPSDSESPKLACESGEKAPWQLFFGRE